MRVTPKTCNVLTESMPSYETRKRNGISQHVMCLSTAFRPVFNSNCQKFYKLSNTTSFRKMHVDHHSQRFKVFYTFVYANESPQ